MKFVIVDDRGYAFGTARTEIAAYRKIARGCDEPLTWRDVRDMAAGGPIPVTVIGVRMDLTVLPIDQLDTDPGW